MVTPCLKPWAKVIKVQKIVQICHSGGDLYKCEPVGRFFWHFSLLVPVVNIYTSRFEKIISWIRWMRKSRKKININCWRSLVMLSSDRTLTESYNKFSKCSGSNLSLDSGKLVWDCSAILQPLRAQRRDSAGEWSLRCLEAPGTDHTRFRLGRVLPMSLIIFVNWKKTILTHYKLTF